MMFTASINYGIKSITQSQEKDGSFLTLSSPQTDSFTTPLSYSSTFATALILSCLNSVPETAELKRIKKKISHYLIKEKSKLWSFNYWKRNSRQSQEKKFPDDLDVTSCVVESLFHYNAKLISGRTVGKIATVLTQLETQVGGPYRTWVVSSDAPTVWKDVDLVVNSNVASMLSLFDVELPNITEFVERKIEKEDFTSPYYNSIFPILYFISRFYRGSYTERLAVFLLSKQHPDNSWGNPLDTALAVSTLLNLGVPARVLEKSVHFISEHRSYWNAYAFCIDPAIGKSEYYSGSAALTTAFCLEALCKYTQYKKLKTTKNSQKNGSNKIYTGIQTNVKKRISLLPKIMREKTFAELEAVTKDDKSRQIPLISYYFAQAVAQKKEIPQELFVRLGAANMYGWLAYSLYDNFYDDEAEIKTLSTANFALREVTEIYTTLASQYPEIATLYREILDKIDAANLWEVTHCRLNIQDKKSEITLPSYNKFEILAERSFGHALGPLVILLSQGISTTSPDFKRVEDFFRHFLIAKQLSDDAHDWEKDLKNGHLNPVVTMILGKRLKQRKLTPYDLVTPRILTSLQALFWEEVIESVSSEIYFHLDTAKAAIEKNSLIQNPALLTNFLSPIEKATDQALEERKKTIDFLSSFKTKS